MAAVAVSHVYPLGSRLNERGDGFEAVQATNLPQEGVAALLEDRRGRLWIGTTGQGLVRMEADAGSFTRLGKADGLLSEWIMALYEDTAGTLWIGTNGEGPCLRDAVRRLNDTRKTVSRKVDLLCNDLVSAYGELSRELDSVRTQEMFRKYIAQAQDLEQLLCHAMDWILRQLGYCNIAIWLSADDAAFQLGAYMKYTIAGEQPLVDALRDGLVRTIAYFDALLRRRQPQRALQLRLEPTQVAERRVQAGQRKLPRTLERPVLAAVDPNRSRAAGPRRTGQQRRGGAASACQERAPRRRRHEAGQIGENKAAPTAPS